MNGKLARLEEQEANFYKSTQLKTDSNKRTLDNDEVAEIKNDNNDDETELTVKKKKKKSKKNKE